MNANNIITRTFNLQLKKPDGMEIVAGLFALIVSISCIAVYYSHTQTITSFDSIRSMIVISVPILLGVFGVSIFKGIPNTMFVVLSSLLVSAVCHVVYFWSLG